jgi:hypothetical protein
VISVLWLLALAQAPSDEGPTPAQLAVRNTGEREYVDEQLEDGRHIRFGTKDSGPVHVWRPRGYKKETAVTVIYLHGFFTDVDRAMLEHALPTQFRDSGRNALFIVPETRSWRTDPLLWKDLDALLTAVEKRTKLERPKGGLIVIAHSGGYRTVVEWLANEALDKVVLVDGLYGSDDDFTKWASEQTKPKQLVLIGFDTQQRTEWFLRKHPKAVRLDDLPYLFDELPAAVRGAPLLYFQDERFDHMGLITSGRLLPWLLHALH